MDNLSIYDKQAIKDEINKIMSLSTFGNTDNLYEALGFFKALMLSGIISIDEFNEYLEKVRTATFTKL